MKKESQIQILLVDDHPVVLEGLTTMIHAQPDMVVVGTATNGAQALEQFQKLQPDITLMDLRLPLMSGIEATAKIRAKSPTAQIIVLTSYDGDEDIYRALEAGARAYLLKDMVRTELIEAIRTVHAGQRFLPSSVANRLADRLSSPDLTARELDVLQFIAKGFSNKRIAVALGISENTVKLHIKNILSKLCVDDRTQAAVLAIQRGIITHQ
jgi:two-component system, NarL family, response regulator